MHVARLSLVGWRCFREAQALELRDVPYAIVARYADDPDRSNWAGKSSLLQAIDWALYGRLPDDAEGKDALISRGTTKVEVTVELSDGSRVTRSKERDRPERLWFWDPTSAGKASMKDEAQAGVVRAVGLDAADFINTSYFRQREMARFVLQDPAARLATVSGWLGLERLERAEEIARERLASALRELEEQGRVLRAAQDQEAASSRALDESLDGDDLTPEEALATLEAELEKVRGEIASAESDLAAAREREVLEKQARSYEETVEEGKRLVATMVSDERLEALRAALTAAEEALQVARSEQSVAAEENKSRRRHAVEFSGVCPVVGLDCPARSFVSGATDERARLAKEAADAYDLACQREVVARHTYSESFAAASRALDVRRKVESLRATAIKLRPAHDRVKAAASRELGIAPAPVEELRRREALAQHKIVALRHQLHLIAQARAVQPELAERVERARAEVDTAREAVLVFGKSGAQRRVAERALDGIGLSATAMLAEAGVPLTVGLRWSREGGGPASHCADCGTPFPKSARVKECERCGAARGPKLVHKLETVLSDRSGAAEDLAAFALQMSASAWLRRERGIAWSTLLLDEPTGQLDVAMRRALTAHLPRHFAATGVTQALVVAHHASVLASFPGRIEIVAGPAGSVARVVA